MRWSSTTSASRGTFSRISVSCVSRLAIISGSVAFLAPEIGMTPLSFCPPTIRMRSILAPDNNDRDYHPHGPNAAKVRPLLTGPFVPRRLSARSCLSLAALEVFAELPRQPRLPLILLRLLFNHPGNIGNTPP